MEGKRHENYGAIPEGGDIKPRKEEYKHDHNTEDHVIVHKEEGGYTYIEDEEDGSNRADDEDNDAVKQEKGGL